MSTLLAEAEGLVPRLALIRAEVDRFQHSAERMLDSGEREYVNLLSSYAAAVESTVTVLVSRQRFWRQAARVARTIP
jgi:hypothetical protein